MLASTAPSELPNQDMHVGKANWLFRRPPVAARIWVHLPWDILGSAHVTSLCYSDHIGNLTMLTELIPNIYIITKAWDQSTDYAIATPVSLSPRLSWSNRGWRRPLLAAPGCARDLRAKVRLGQSTAVLEGLAVHSPRKSAKNELVSLPRARGGLPKRGEQRQGEPEGLCRGGSRTRPRARTSRQNTGWFGKTKILNRQWRISLEVPPLRHCAGSWFM